MLNLYVKEIGNLVKHGLKFFKVMVDKNVNNNVQPKTVQYNSKI